jgi:dCMP deaminase
MPTQKELNNTYMTFAFAMADLSKAERKKVGAVIVTKNGVVLTGVNGQPKGWDNTCEDENNTTLNTTIHAELNCILKAAKEGVSVIDADLYVTLSPCVQCAAMIVQAGIKRVYYFEDYRDMSGVELLIDNGISVARLERED